VIDHQNFVQVKLNWDQSNEIDYISVVDAILNAVVQTMVVVLVKINTAWMIFQHVLVIVLDTDVN
jgi:hypothetical protein